MGMLLDFELKLRISPPLLRYRGCTQRPSMSVKELLVSYNLHTAVFVAVDKGNKISLYCSLFEDIFA